MKTFKALSMLLVPVGLGFLVASCGGSGGSNRGIPNGRLNLKIGDFIIQKPFIDEQDVCLDPKIEIVVPRSSGLCRDNAQLDNWIQLRTENGAVTPVFRTTSFRQVGSSDTCVVETKPTQSLIPGTPYVIGINIEGAGPFVFRPGNASRFTTAANGNGAECSSSFKVVNRTSGEAVWQGSNILDTFQYNSQTDDLNFDEGNLQNFLIDNAASLFMNFIFQPTPPSSMRVEFSDDVQAFGLRSYIRVYEFAPSDRSQIESGFSLFREYSQLNQPRNCLGDPDGGPNGECIWIDPSDPRVVRIVHPNGAWPNGLSFMIFILKGLQSKRLQALDQSYYRLLR